MLQKRRFLIPALVLGVAALSALGGLVRASVYAQTPATPAATVRAGSGGAGLGGGSDAASTGSGGAGLGGGGNAAGGPGGAGLGGGGGATTGANSGGAGLGGGGATVTSTGSGAGLGGGNGSSGGGAGLGGGGGATGGGAGLQSQPAPLEITRDSNGQTYHVAVGQQVTIRLGTDLDWTVNYEPPGILTAVPGVNTLVRGVQGILRAQKPGTVQVKAQGKPHCNPGQACPALIAVMNATVIVDAPSGGGGSVQQPGPGTNPATTPRPSGGINLPNTGTGGMHTGTAISTLLLPTVVLLSLLATGAAGALSRAKR